MPAGALGCSHMHMHRHISCPSERLKACAPCHLQTLRTQTQQAQLADSSKVEQLLCSGGLPQQLLQQWQLAHLETGVGLREAFRMGQQLQRACAKYEGEGPSLPAWPRVAPCCACRCADGCQDQRSHVRLQAALKMQGCSTPHTTPLHE